MIIKRNLNGEELKMFMSKLNDNSNYCPCVLNSKDNQDYKCMCKDFREQESGTCYCGLFTKIKD